VSLRCAGVSSGSDVHEGYCHSICSGGKLGFLFDVDCARLYSSIVAALRLERTYDMYIEH